MKMMFLITEITSIPNFLKYSILNDTDKQTRTVNLSEIATLRRLAMTAVLIFIRDSVEDLYHGRSIRPLSMAKRTSSTRFFSPNFA